MGTWGTAVFSDDLAADIRDDWRALLAAGKSGVEATRELVERHSESIRDSDDGPVFWIALAASQWRTGRLQEDVRVRALDVIESGRNLERWTTPRDRAKRQKVLQKLALELRSPQPSARPIKKPVPHIAEFASGSVVVVRLNQTLLALLRVARLSTEDESSYCVFELLRWSASVVPSIAEVQHLESVIDPFPVTPKVAGLPEWTIAIAPRKKDYPADRLSLLSNEVFRERRPNEGWAGYTTWKTLITIAIPARLDLDPAQFDPF